MSLAQVSAVLLFTGAVCFVIGAFINLWTVFNG